MSALESEIDELRRLDEHRVRSARLRDQGRKALAAPRDGGWQSTADPIEDALQLKALCYRGADEALLRQLVVRLEALPLDDTESKSPIPILRAARIMQALVAAPNSALTSFLLFRHYRLVRELYTADAPRWTTGGASAGVGGLASAFVTGECVRALLGFIRTINNTATFLGGIGNLYKDSNRPKEDIPKRWKEVESKRSALSFYITIKKFTGNLALRFPKSLDPNNVDAFLETIRSNLPKALDAAKREFEKVRQEVTKLRDLEVVGARGKSFSTTRLHISESGHQVALGAVIDACKRAARAGKTAAPEHNAETFKELKRQFRHTADGVRRLLQPAEKFLSAVLDRELARAAVADAGLDTGEMACAAASYGAITGAWDDERIKRAGLCLAQTLSERGRFPRGAPFHVTPEGYELRISDAEVLQAFALLLEKVPSVPVDSQLAKRMLTLFEDTQLADVAGEVRGWYSNEPRPRNPSRGSTALSILTLDRINRMLDARINQRVFQHFSVKPPKPPSLDELFYGDYGLRPTDDPPSLAILLERMRAHVEGVPLPEKRLALHSIVLHGPPGTGKTTLMEALACACGVQLVEVTPSDIVIGGVDVIEARVRAVFTALSLLTRAVIIFDEFEPVLEDRKTQEKNSRQDVFSFVTPGMLPKLKALYEAAKKRGVAYALVTNLIWKLDSAAIREGRFDRKVGVYPPDLLSRVGRLRGQLAKFNEEQQKRKKEGQKQEEKGIEKVSGKLRRESEERFRRIIRRSQGASMEMLVKEGWGRPPSSLEESKTFKYLAAGGDEPEALPETEDPRLDKRSEKNNERKKEQEEWGWVKEWDRKLGDNLKEALEKTPKRTKKRK